VKGLSPRAKWLRHKGDVCLGPWSIMHESLPHAPYMLSWLWCLGTGTAVPFARSITSCNQLPVQWVLWVLCPE